MKKLIMDCEKGTQKLIDLTEKEIALADISREKHRVRQLAIDAEVNKFQGRKLSELSGEERDEILFRHLLDNEGKIK